jgi:hypothetical protein
MCILLPALPLPLDQGNQQVKLFAQLIEELPA